jgi:ATP/maltotriose-dependent transcriptional regulator MalT/DNA-binding SARP family transcriptional activator
MLPQLFLRTKLLPPRIGRQVLPRPRLMARMKSYLDGPATIVCANAGCGKTTLVADFVPSCHIPFVWYQIDPSDEDIGVFFGYLVYGLRRLYPDFGQAVLGFIRATEDLSSQADQLADVFVTEVSEQIEQKTILVLDDFHHADKSTAIGIAVDRLVQYLPDVLHIVLMSRTMPNLSVSRLRSKGLVGIIDRQDLLFVPEEVNKLFEETFSRTLPPDLLTQFYEKTEGWITGLQLIQQSIDRTTDQDPTLISKAEAVNALQQSEIDIFDYFAEEVLQAESAETRLTLARLSMFERISPEVCEAIFGGADYRTRLRALARQNVFVTHTYASGSEEEYRLHPLFRSFLRRWLSEEMGGDVVRQQHRQCADYFAGASQWDLAVHHYSEASAFGALVDLLAEQGAELVRLGRFEVIKRAFEQVQEESFIGRARALIAPADVAMIEGDHALALTLYDRAAPLAREAGDRGVEAESLRGKAYIARRAGDFDQAVDLASSAIEAAPDLHFLRARCFNVIGLCRFRSSHDTDGAIESWRAALDEARLAGDDRFARIVLHNLGLPYSMEGDLNEAIHWISQMIDARPAGSEGALQEQSAPFPQEAIAHLNLARLKIAQGRFDEAELHLELALERCRVFNLLTSTAETLEAFGNLYRERGDYSKSLEFYDEAARAYRVAGLSLSDRELLDERATLFLQMGQVSAAEHDAEMYFQARREGSAAERSTALITRGRIEMAAGRSDAAEASLVEAAGLTHVHNLHYLEARAATSLARLFWETSRPDEALAKLALAVELSLRFDYSHWLSTEAAQSPALFRAAIAAGCAKEYLARLMAEEAAIAESGTPVPAQRITGTIAQPQFTHMIERPNFDLTVNMLGPIEVYRNRLEPSPDDAWRLTKSLHILCHIASHRNHRATKDSLVDLFWPDADADTIAKNFHPMISHARKALNLGQVIKKDFILYREGAYLLNPQYRYQIDTEEFELLIAEARKKRQSGDTEGAAQMTVEAVGLYRGDFLEELYSDWVEELRSYYRDLYLEALKELAGFYAARDDHEQVVRYCQKMLQRDPYREDAHCQVMEAYVGMGNRAAAIEQFDRLRKLLRSELGVAPLPATVAKYESLIK